MSGARIHTYLLERSRLVAPSKGERNYHVFYQASPRGFHWQFYGPSAGGRLSKQAALLRRCAPDSNGMGVAWQRQAQTLAATFDALTTGAAPPSLPPPPPDTHSSSPAPRPKSARAGAWAPTHRRTR
jgi:hypothetical protein